MNKKIIFVLLFTIIALVILFLFSFGPLANIRKAYHINPASIQPVNSNSLESATTYRNSDVKENYYTIKIPKDWKVSAGQNPGGYLLDSHGTVELMDVSDNTTLELFVLSQSEPQLKKDNISYQRLDYKKLTINSYELYQLTYQTKNNSDLYKTIKTYISGADHMAVITLTSRQSASADLSALASDIINSFQWDNK